MPRLTEKQDEQIGQIHHSASELIHLAFLCMREARPGREWLLRMRHAHERIGQMLDKLEGRS